MCSARQFLHLQGRTTDVTRDEEGVDSTQSTCTNWENSLIVSNDNWEKISLCERHFNENLYNDVDNITDQETSRHCIITPALKDCTDKDLRAAQLNQSSVPSMFTSSVSTTGGIYEKRLPDFEGKKRDHHSVHHWVQHHHIFHQLNLHITSMYCIMNSAQYLSDTAVIWFESLEQCFAESEDNFEKFVQLFLTQWDELNWCDKALTIFHSIQQEDTHSDIKIYNDVFQKAHLAVSEEVTPYVAVRTYIESLKLKMRLNLKQSFTFNQSSRWDLEINETMTIAVQFKVINKTINQDFMSFRNCEYNQLFNTNTDINTRSAEESELNVMQALRDLFKVQCYNCQQFRHIQVYCRSSWAASTDTQNDLRCGCKKRKNQAENKTPYTE